MKYQQMAQNKDVVMYLYIVDEEDKLLGVIDIKEILMSDEKSFLRDIMVDNVISLKSDSTLKEASSFFKRYGFRAVPIVDEDEHILGVIPYKDVINLKHRFL